MNNQLPVELCGVDGCRLLANHKSPTHNPYPTVAWDFMQSEDKNKLNKAGFATPRGGAKGAYQNHVTRSSRVIVPFEKLSSVNLTDYTNGYVIRLFPEQYFHTAGQPKVEFSKGEYAWIKVGENAFVNYRFHNKLQNFPPLDSWGLRALEKNGVTVKKRGRGVIDTGHYTLRIPKHGQYQQNYAGAVQGVFAPEYATEEVNFLSKSVLAWLIIHTERSPYTTTQASHLKTILAHDELLNDEIYEYKGVMRRGVCCCPLCLRFIRYEDLHKMAIFEDDNGEDNAAEQVEGATRSTVVNLFHLAPLKYSSISHIPSNVAWGHHICNTRLGQRACLSLSDLVALNRKVAIISDENDYLETLGWISDDDQMIRAPGGAVWIRIVSDMADEGLNGADTPPGMDETVLIDESDDLDTEEAID